ncbi:hypothetical protein DH2020_016220 [Rehmannia glutinosa]|uniref:ABC transporter domain-containing protein n=1 Tax=Rehmannia glutinosa TaxID=99300 RepID=A0ABR0W6P0_REHGL
MAVLTKEIAICCACEDHRPHCGRLLENGSFRRFIKDFRDTEWNKAFNFSKNTQFLAECLKTDRDAVQRLCTAAEVKFYGASLIENAQSGSAKSSTYLKPNKNCNLSSWPSGCEPGWACSVGKDTKVDLKNSKDIPLRDIDCQSCCQGFFCPRGLTCMIREYRYQLPPGQPNHTCGGADIWADFLSGKELFCSAGFYCPTTTQKLACSRGAGSTAQTSKSNLASSLKHLLLPFSDQNVFFANFLLNQCGFFLLYTTAPDKFSVPERKKQAKSREAAARSARETVQARERWKSAKEVARKGASELQSQLSRTFSRKKSVSQDSTKSSGIPKPDAKGKKKKESNLTKMMRDLEENPDGDEGFNMEIGDKNLKKNAAKAKQLQTRSQIFKYAYGQIEKEKALQEQNKNLTFSGVISIAWFGILEQAAYRMPGHVSAVMGPSGAGKTTFLSALTGKATGCTITGSILINGKDEPMQSYKRIIGYVPQDDIVHGNLTVEENLWFSARCRLPADIDKAEKVLVVERVIESLGLQAVRDSLVGTVEKRGISGGQRKRVNVGLEMVMEPSLLILDEPTSGLDSSSSLLLLRALRREALEGVNICMVVHQPSYTLFKMFDDLILLAKGGLTVYHGPVKKVEEYFAGIGIVVPERVNPPDYFIDILEGIVKPSASTAVKFKELPLRWMLHNGYPVPPDMLDSAGVASSSAKIRPRLGKQRLREARIQAVDYLILLLAGVCLGTLAKVSDETFGSTGYLYTVIAVSLLCKIAALRSFSLDKLHYWRESASGMSSLAYFLAKDTVDHFSTIVKPAVYLSMFYFFNNPRSTIFDNYLVLLCLVYCVTGIAYVLAIYFEPGPAQLWSVLLPVVLTLIANQEGDTFVTKLGDFCYTKWALEAFLLANAERIPAYYGILSRR